MKSHQVNFLLAGFSHFEPQWRRGSGGAILCRHPAARSKRSQDNLYGLKAKASLEALDFRPLVFGPFWNGHWCAEAFLKKRYDTERPSSLWEASYFVRMHIQVSCVLFLDILGKTCKEVHLENQYKSSNDMTTVSLLQCSWPDAYLSQKLVKWISLKNLIAAIKRLKHLLSSPCTIVHVQHCNFVKSLGHLTCNQTCNQMCNRAMEILTIC